MELFETVVIKDAVDVNPRLAELGLELNGLLRVVDVALQESGNATPFHCANAPGTFAYQHGTFALRNEHVGQDWVVDRTEGVEGIFNRTRNVRIVFSNVDRSCDEYYLPKPRSKKGSGAERVCTGNLFGYLPHFAPRPEGGSATFYLMMDEDGNAELSRPVVRNETFESCLERVFLTENRGIFEPMPLDEDDVMTDFDPVVARKQ